MSKNTNAPPESINFEVKYNFPEITIYDVEYLRKKLLIIRSSGSNIGTIYSRYFEACRTGIDTIPMIKDATSDLHFSNVSIRAYICADKDISGITCEFTHHDSKNITYDLYYLQNVDKNVHIYVTRITDGERTFYFDHTQLKFIESDKQHGVALDDTMVLSYSYNFPPPTILIREIGRIFDMLY